MGSGKRNYNAMRRNFQKIKKHSDKIEEEPKKERNEEDVKKLLKLLGMQKGNDKNE